MIECVFEYWGILAVALGVIVVIFLDREIAKEWAFNLVLEVEKNARLYCLERIEEKLGWVYSWYEYLPPIVKLLVSKALWQKFVDEAYSKILGGSMKAKA